MNNINYKYMLLYITAYLKQINLLNIYLCLCICNIYRYMTFVLHVIYIYKTNDHTHT